MGSERSATLSVTREEELYCERMVPFNCSLIDCVCNPL